jgi:uncharacterized protein YgiM (DUF1202 family)
LLARRFTLRAIRRVCLRRRWAAVEALRFVRRTAFFALPALRAIFARADLGRRAEAGRAAGRRVDFLGFFLVVAMVSSSHRDATSIKTSTRHRVPRRWPKDHACCCIHCRPLRVLQTALTCGERTMRKILTVAALMGGMFVASAALADNINKNQSDTPGTTGTQVGDSMNEPMVVSADNGNVREAPNAQAKILTTVPHGHRVTVIGTANGGAWAHIMVDGLDGYMDFVQLDKIPYGSENYNTGYYNNGYNNGYATYYSVPSQGVRYMAVTSDAAIVRQGPTVDSQVVATLPRGSRVTVIGTSNGWAHVQGNGVDGYTDYVQLADVSSPPNTTYYTIYPSTSPTYYQPAPTYQTTPTYQYQSTPTYYQTSPTYRYESTPTYYQTSPTYPYQSTPTYYQTTPTYQYQSSTTTYYNPTTRVVNGYGGTIHMTPDANSSLVATVPPGAQVTVVGTANGRWAHVVANGYDGYMDYAELQ